MSYHQHNVNDVLGRLELVRPLVAIDLETTGLDIGSDRIVEICCVKLGCDGHREVRTHRVDPCMPISAEAVRVHGIENADVRGQPTFAQLAQSLYAFLGGCDLTGFNVERFDLPLLRREFEREGLQFPHPGVRVLDSWQIFLRKEPRDLAAATQFYCGRPLTEAHSARADAEAAADVLLAQVARYRDLPADIAGLEAYCHPSKADWVDSGGKILWKDDQAVLAFGRHKDEPLAKLVNDAPDYLRWIVNKANLAPDVVSIVRAALDGSLPRRETRP